MRRLPLRRFLVVPAAFLLVFGGAALAETVAQYAAARQAILNHYAALAKQEDPGFKGFSAAAGVEALFAEGRSVM